MSDADCTPGREPRSVAASYVFYARKYTLILPYTLLLNRYLFMAAVCNRAGHLIIYFHPVVSSSSFFFFLA